MDEVLVGSKNGYMDAVAHVSAMADDVFEPLAYKPVSADSHVTEPPNCYTDYIDPAYRDIAPHTVRGPNGGDLFVVDGMDKPIPIAIVAAAGLNPKDIRLDAYTFDQLHRGGWDGKVRVADQDRDGIAAEVVYPSIGMALCNHPDPNYKQACFMAYNRWLQEFQSAAPDRIFGIGQTAVTSVKQTIADIERIKEMGFRGVMLPCDPATEEDYDDPAFDAVWEAAVSLNMPLSFHILTSGRGSVGTFTHRGKGTANFSHTALRANQDVVGMFIWGRVFERFPSLKLVCVEADAGWAPHFMYRMDHFYNRHRFWSKTDEMRQLPSEYFLENIYMTFQDDYVALQTINLLNPERLLWANDFPHSDSTWPWSQQLIARQTKALSEVNKRKILRDNVIELYNLPLN